VEQEVGTAAIAEGAGPYANRVLNLTGSRTEWASMKAQIYSVTEDLGTGRTTLHFGPHKYLSPADLVAQLRASRTRVIPELEERAGGVTSGGEQKLPATHKTQTPGKVEATPDLTVPNGGHSVTIRLTGISGTLPGSNLTLQPRTIQVCEGGVMKTVLVLCTESW
jgi:hypothetical protein